MIRLDVTPAEPCVWMAAGLVQYKLCQCHYDCEHCALDAAMRGTAVELEPHSRTHATPARRAESSFPTDRVYCPGHTWLQPVEQSAERYRLGIDSFAALLITCPRRICWHVTPRIVRVGEPLLDLEFDDGCLSFSAPVVARLLDWNRSLDHHPDAIIADPYDSGWLVSLMQVEPDAASRFASAQTAAERARLDMRRLRRRIGLHLLAEESDGAVASSSTGEVFADPWHALGGVGYLGIVGEVLH